MSFIKNNLKNIIIALIVLIGGYYLYSYFFPGTDTTQTLSVTSPASVDTSIGGELLLVLTDLKTLKLDDSIFSDPEFKNLRNFRVELNPEPVGRDNPFAPISGSGSSGNSGIQIKNFKTSN
jgi:hypothetical protein